jgi:hypothetical protein
MNLESDKRLNIQLGAVRNVVGIGVTQAPEI